MVITVVAILAAASGPALSALSSSGGTNQNISTLSGILEQAREYAVAQNTFVWVTFYAPGATNGVNQVTVAVVASADGSDPADASPSGWQQYNYGAVPSSGLSVISKIVTLKQVAIEKAGSLTNPPTSLPPKTPAVADPANSIASYTSGFFSITVPGTTSPVTFTQAIEFTPSGQARNTSGPVDVIDLDVQPQRGTVNDQKNVAVLRVNGLTGETSVYRD